MHPEHFNLTLLIDYKDATWCMGDKMLEKFCAVANLNNCNSKEQIFNNKYNFTVLLPDHRDYDVEYPTLHDRFKHSYEKHGQNGQ